MKILLHVRFVENNWRKFPFPTNKSFPEEIICKSYENKVSTLDWIKDLKCFEQNFFKFAFVKTTKTQTIVQSVTSKLTEPQNFSSRIFLYSTSDKFIFPLEKSQWEKNVFVFFGILSCRQFSPPLCASQPFTWKQETTWKIATTWGFCYYETMQSFIRFCCFVFYEKKESLFACYVWS